MQSVVMCSCPVLVTTLDVIFRMLEISNFQLVVDFINIRVFHKNL